MAEETKAPAIVIESTKDLLKKSYVNAIIYGPSGIGKTPLLTTAPDTLILSAERGGLLSIVDQDIASTEVGSLADAIKVYNFLKAGDHPYKTVGIDSLSEIAEKVLNKYLKEFNDPRQAYGKMALEVKGMFDKFRELDMHVFFIAKLSRIEDSMTGRQMYAPAFPGKILQQDLPYMTDLLMSMRKGKHKGKEYVYLQTEADLQYMAKDRSVKLRSKEKPDLQLIINRIIGDAHSTDEMDLPKEDDIDKAPDTAVA